MTSAMFRLKEQNVLEPRRKRKNRWQLEELKEGSGKAESEGEKRPMRPEISKSKK